MWVVLVSCAALDTEGPVLEVTAPEGPVRESATLEIRATDASPGLATLSLEVGGTAGAQPLPIPEDGVLTWDLGVAALEDGGHLVRITATDRSWLANTVVYDIRVQVDQTAPTLEVPEISQNAAQGSTLAVWARADEPLIAPTVTLGGHELPMFDMDGAWRALVGIGLGQQPGPATLEVRGADAVGNVSTHTVSVEIATPTPQSKQAAAPRDDQASHESQAEPDPFDVTDTPDQLWDGPMALPLPSGHTTSPFGPFHNGIDLESRRHTPTKAAAAGTVVGVHEQAIMGGVVIVDHGHGVMTSYSHLDQIDVTLGDVVGRSDRLGTTGKAGPNLHWGLVVGRQAVDPAPWLTEAFSTPPFREAGD